MIRLALTSGAIALGTLSYAASALAQSVNVEHSGSVPATCNFGTPTNGVLKYLPATNILSSRASDNSTPGQVTLTCNSPATLQIAPPVVINKPGAFTGTLNQCEVNVKIQTGTGFAESSYQNISCSTPANVSNFITNAAGASGTLNVETAVKGSVNFPVGNYTVRTTLTVTP